MTTMQAATEVQTINDKLKLIPTHEGETFWAEIDGVQIPRLTVSHGTQGRYEIMLDGRFPATVTSRELYQVLNLVANALAISGGFSFMRASVPAHERRNTN